MFCIIFLFNINTFELAFIVSEIDATYILFVNLRIEYIRIYKLNDREVDGNVYPIQQAMPLLIAGHGHWVPESILKAKILLERE